MKEDRPPMERSRLRAMARASAGGSDPDLEGLSTDDVKVLVHEFGVYQVELEAQNEELRKTRLAFQEASARYRDLYDFAPVGYFTLSRTGKILETNLTGCGLLGGERSDPERTLSRNGKKGSSISFSWICRCLK